MNTTIHEEYYIIDSTGNKKIITEEDGLKILLNGGRCYYTTTILQQVSSTYSLSLDTTDPEDICYDEVRTVKTTLKIPD